MFQTNRIILFIIIGLFLFSFKPISHVSANIEENQSEKESLINKVDVTEVEQYWRLLINEYGSYLPEITEISFRELIKEHQQLSLKNIAISIGKYFFYEVITNGKLLSILLVLAVFSAVLQTIHTAFENSTISQIAYFIIYLVLFYLALNSFMLTFSYTKSTIQMMSDFIIALIPLLLGILATIGNVLTVSFFHPLIIFIINLTNILITNFILPLLLMALLLMMVSHINKKYQVTHLANLFRNISLGTLGIFSTLFLSIMSIQGTASAIQDGLALKTAKFVTGNFIPVIGKTFTDAVDVVLSVSLTLKNSIGIIGVLIILLFSLFPIIKILVVALIYKLSAAIVQPIGDQSIVNTLNTISNFTFYILACLVAVTIMFFLAIVIIILASNITMFIK